MPEECMQNDPCTNATCPRYTSTECCVMLANGECKAEFYQLPGFSQVTSDCYRGIERCEGKVCRGERVCMEEVLGCPETKPDCGIKRVKSSCILMPAPRFPVTCAEVVCQDGSTCDVSDTRNGRVAECKPVIQKTCNETNCDDGFQCQVREQKNGEPIARCIVIRQAERASDCSELECPEDMICVLLSNNRGARCAKPPPPKNCDELECAVGLECVDVQSSDRVRCAPVNVVVPPEPEPQSPQQEIARKCDDLECEPGYECKLVSDRERNGNKRFVATCVPSQCPVRRPPRPPQRCQELRCAREEMCVLCGEGPETTARCVPRSKCYLCLHNNCLGKLILHLLYLAYCFCTQWGVCLRNCVTI